MATNRRELRRNRLVLALTQYPSGAVVPFDELASLIEMTDDELRATVQDAVNERLLNPVFGGASLSAQGRNFAQYIRDEILDQREDEEESNRVQNMFARITAEQQAKRESEERVAKAKAEPVEQPTISASEGMRRLKSQLEKGKQLLAGTFTYGGLDAWKIASNNAIAAAFGRNSDTHNEVTHRNYVDLAIGHDSEESALRYRKQLLSSYMERMEGALSILEQNEDVTRASAKVASGEQNALSSIEQGVKVKSIFISHDTTDKLLAEALTNLLIHSEIASREDIVCSSVTGMEIPDGADLKGYLKAEVSNQSLFVALATSTYFGKPFCMCELGAVWVLGGDIFPIVIPPMNHSDMNGMLKGLIANALDDGLIDRFKDRVSKVTGKYGQTSVWNAEKKKFFEAVDKYKTDHSRPTSSPKPRMPEGFSAGHPGPIRLPPPSASTGGEEQLEQVVSALDALPEIVVASIFKCHFHGKWDPAYGGFTDLQTLEAIEDGLLEWDKKPSVKPSYGNKRVQSVMTKLDKLDSWMKQQTDEWADGLKSRLGCDADLWTRDFWRSALEVTGLR